MQQQGLSLGGGLGGGLNLGGLGQGQPGLQLGQMRGLGQMSQAQTGSLQLGQLQQLQSAQGGGLQLGQSSLGGGLQLGQTPQQAGGLQLGLGQGTSAAGLQLGQTQTKPHLGLATQLGQGGAQLGQPGGVGGLQLGGLGQASQAQQSGLGVGLLTQTQTPQTGGLKLGQASQASGLQLGQTTLKTGLQLGQTSQASGLQLGQTLGQTSQASGLQLGQTLGQTSQASGLQLGQTLGQTSQASGLQLGQTLGQTSQASGLQLGQTLGQTSQASGLQLGQTTLKTGLQLGQTSQASGLQLGQTLGQTSQASGLQLGQLLKPGGTSTTAVSVAPTTAKLGLSLPQPAATTAAVKPTSVTAAGLGGTTGLGLGMALPTSKPSNGGLKLNGLATTAMTSSATGLGVGLGGLKKTAASTVPSLGLSVPTAATTKPTSTLTTEFKGLGGVGTAETTTRSSAKDGSSILSEQVPPELVQLITGFEQFLKKQKAESDEISKYSDTSLKKILTDTSTQSQVLGVVSSQVQKDAQTVSFLAQETSEELRNAEVAQRTRELPAWLQKENTAPDLYFQNLVASFEAKMELYRRQIEELESHLSAISAEASLSPQNIIEILQLQYKPFLLLAAQLQVVHEHVQNLKEQYLSYRKVFLQDSTDVFEERRKKSKPGNGGGDQIQVGPSPFATVIGQAPVGLATTANGGLQGALGGQRLVIGVANPTMLGGQQIGVGRLGGLGGGALGGAKTGVGLGGGALGGANLNSGLGLGTLGGVKTGLGLGGGGTLGGAKLGLGGGGGLGLGSAISQPSLGSMPASMPVTKPVLPQQQLPQQQQQQQQQQTGAGTFVLGKPPAGRKRNA